MKFLNTLLAMAALGACTASSMATALPTIAPAPAVFTNCPARDVSSAIEWQISNRADAAELSRWCRAVGNPVLVEAPAAAAATLPPLDELVMVSWNAHLAEGELGTLVGQLRSGELTGGRPVAHFVLLVQELYRRGDVPEFDSHDRSAHAVRPRDPESPDIDDHAASLGLSIFYVPSMRNGPELREDRGNAIISTEPLLDPFALELPLARQRRVALGAAVQIRTNDGAKRLEVMDVHLEPLSSPKTLWVFKNPRASQLRAILDVLDAPRYASDDVAGIVLGGDFNTVRAGASEDAYRLARTWATGFGREDGRMTHMMGRLDYLFFRSDKGWRLSTNRLNERFGSDHYPVLGTFSQVVR